MSPATEYKGHLQLKCSTAEWHIKNHTSVSYVQLTGCRTHSWGYENTVAEHDVQIDDILPAFYGYAHFC